MTPKAWLKPTALVWTCGLALAGGTPAPAHAAGFTAPDPGVKAQGMAGAFAAQANDPTAVFYNPGGMALFKKGKLTAAGKNIFDRRNLISLKAVWEDRKWIRKV